MCKDNMIKIPISLEDKWQTNCDRQFHRKDCKVHKKWGMDLNIILICDTRKVIEANLNFEQQFDSLSFKLILLS